MIGSFVTFGGFPSKFLKCSFHRCIWSSWLAAFSLVFAVLFLLLTSLTVCHVTQDCLSSTKSLILLIWFCMYSACSFRYALVSSICAFLSFWALILVGFLLLHKECGFHVCTLFLTTNISRGTRFSSLFS